MKDKIKIHVLNCGYTKESWENIRLAGPLSDKDNMIKSLKWVQTMAKDKNCVEVLATHDPNIKPHVIEL